MVLSPLHAGLQQPLLHVIRCCHYSGRRLQRQPRPASLRHPPKSPVRDSIEFTSPPVSRGPLVHDPPGEPVNSDLLKPKSHLPDKTIAK